MLYIETGENAKKVVLLAKQRGKEGTTLKDLVYPAKVSFNDPGAAPGQVARLILKLPEIKPSSQVAALAVGALDRIEAKPTGTAGEYTLASAPGSQLFVAVKNGGRILVGWPPGSDEKTRTLVKAAMPDSEDFFDERRILGVYRDEAKGFLYSVVLGSRKGKTTLAEARSQPWRLELYRWKLDDDGARTTPYAPGVGQPGARLFGAVGCLARIPLPGTLFVLGREGGGEECRERSDAASAASSAAAAQRQRRPAWKLL